MTSSRPNYLRRRVQGLITGGILLVGGVVAVGGMIAVDRIQVRLGERDGINPGRVFHQAQEMQFHLTEAVEEGFAYLVSGDDKEKAEFMGWTDRFPNEVAELERLMRKTDSDTEEDRILLGQLAQAQKDLVESAQDLFVEFERSGGVSGDSFRQYEEIVDRAIQDARGLSALRRDKLEADRLEMIAALESAERIVRRSALLAMLFAVIVAAAVLRVLTRERAARAQAENVFRDLYDHSPDMHVSVDATSSNIVKCNQTTLDVLGYRKSQIVGRPVLDLYDRGSRAQARDCLESFLTTGQASADHLQLVTASGDPIDVSLRVTAVCDKHGRILRSRSVWRDIRTQIEVEKALRSGEARYRTLVESAPVCIHEVGCDGKLINMNAAGLAMIHRTDPASISGIPYIDCVRDADRDRIAGLIQRALDGESVEYEFTSETSPVREFRSSLVPIRDEEGTVVRLMGVTQDLTEHRAGERALRQKQKMEAVGRLAGGIAHDFNNLLTVITGYCEELKRSLDTASRESRYVTQVSMAAAQAATLTKQLLAFSRHQKRAPVVLHLDEVIADLETMISRLIGDDITLETRSDGHIGPIKADAGQIEQILVNLAANARDAMPTGGKLRIETRAVDGGARVRMDVSDTGLGMKPEIRERVFEPFYTTKESGRGTGLGLATVLGIVEQNDGRIEIESETGRGTRVAIEFPCVADWDATTTAPEREGSTETRSGTETVLLAEDQEAVRKLTKRALEAQGFTVLEARDGVEALRVAREYRETIDLLLSDVVMPRMGGPELWAKLQDMLPTLKVVFVSGHAGQGERGSVPEDAVLVAKPYRSSELIAVLRDVLDVAGQEST